MGTFNISNATLGYAGIITGGLVAAASFAPIQLPVHETALFIGGLGMAAGGAAFALSDLGGKSSI